MKLSRTQKIIRNTAIVIVLIAALPLLFDMHFSPDKAAHEALEKAGIPMVEAQVAMVPQTYVDLTDEKDVKNLQRTLDLLDEDDDVTDVWTNWNE